MRHGGHRAIGVNDAISVCSSLVSQRWTIDFVDYIVDLKLKDKPIFYSSKSSM